MNIFYLARRIRLPRRIAVLICCAICLGATPSVSAQPVSPGPSAPGESQRLPLLLRKLDRTARVLYVTAHPDDEHAGLIARWGYREGVEIALLTLTRGRGGQNEIGDELFGSLAVLRAAELEAAHHYDGARQMFGRAVDFGYSFSVEETLERWDAEKMRRDLVQAIRSFQPDVVLTMQPDGPGGGQHHQASARLARLAVELAATDQLPELGASHGVQQLYAVLWRRARGKHLTEVDIGSFDPLLGGSYAELGLRSREMHKCQGMVRVTEPFEPASVRLELLYDATGELSASVDPWSVLPRTWLENADGAPTRFGDNLAVAVSRVRQAYRPESPGDLLGPLRILRDLIQAQRAQADGPALVTLTQRVDEALTLACQLRSEARSPGDFVAAGSSIPVTVALENAGQHSVVANLRLIGPAGASGSAERSDTVYWEARQPLGSQKRWSEAITVKLPNNLQPSLFAAERPQLVLNHLPTFRLEVEYEFQGAKFSAPPTALHAVRRIDAFPELRRSAVEIVPDPSLRPVRNVVAAPHANDAPIAQAEFRVSALEAGEITVDFLCETEGWSAEPKSIQVWVPGGGVEIPVTVKLEGPTGFEGQARVYGRVKRTNESSARPSSGGYRVVDYPHIDRNALWVPARVEVSAFVCQPPTDVQVGYIEGTGDSSLEALALLGVEALPMTATDLTSSDLSQLDVILVGVRAYKVRDDLIAAHPRLMDWVEAGGTLLVQYQKLEFNGDSPAASPFAPLPAARVGRGRITDETADVVLDQPLHSIFRTPNLIGPADWDDWVQERGLYFLEFDGEGYQNLVTMEDPFPYNAGPKTGALVEARVGKGRWIYVGLGLFRQLPAGVPGSYRLLSNLISAGG